MAARCFENVDRDDQVDLFKFPVPLLHELDGGRYIGTGDLVIMRDPDDGWVNIGTYRVMVHDKNHVGLWMSPGKHGRLIRDKWFAKGKNCPVVISVGHDPLLFLSAGNEVNYGTEEFAHAAGHRGIPFDVINSELHGLPMPAHGEIVIEGEIMMDDARVPRVRSANGPATMRARSARIRWSRCSGSITATARSSPWRVPAARRRTIRCRSA